MSEACRLSHGNSQETRREVVDHHSNGLPVFSESFFMQKVNYIHFNPVEAGLVECAQDYHWSSGRQWLGRMSGDEPLRMDLEKIDWRRPP